VYERISGKRVVLHIAGNHRPDFHTRTGKLITVSVSQLRRLADNRKRKTGQAGYMGKIQGNQLRIRQDNFMELLKILFAFGDIRFQIFQLAQPQKPVISVGRILNPRS